MDIGLGFGYVVAGLIDADCIVEGNIVPGAMFESLVRL